MDKLSCMTTFCHVVKEGGFSAAARRLSISKVMVSRAVSQLEEELGLRLLQRTTRKMSLTDEGKRYYEGCQTLIDEHDTLDRLMKEKGQTVQGTLKIAVPSESFSIRYLMPFFKKMAFNYPELKLEIDMSDRLIDIVEEGFDVAIRIGMLDDSTLIAKKIAQFEILLCASDDYIEQTTSTGNTIHQPKDIENHPFILDSNYRAGRQLTLEREGNRISEKISPQITVNNATATKEFILANAGIGILPDFAIKEEMQNHQIKQILPDWKISQGGIYAVYSHRKHLSEKVRYFINEITDYFAQYEKA